MSQPIRHQTTALAALGPHPLEQTLAGPAQQAENPSRSRNVHDSSPTSERPRSNHQAYGEYLRQQTNHGRALIEDSNDIALRDSQW
ncbi:hypothetical protein [Micromonospora sp. NBC_01412]|uniref:hypothetical protein n=1 Tax=Micromonospora sp. NBC_01412 TaxID=2903590 RepID=UPI00324372F5